MHLPEGWDCGRHNARGSKCDSEKDGGPVAQKRGRSTSWGEPRRPQRIRKEVCQSSLGYTEEARLEGRCRSPGAPSDGLEQLHRVVVEERMRTEDWPRHGVCRGEVGVRGRRHKTGGRWSSSKFPEENIWVTARDVTDHPSKNLEKML